MYRALAKDLITEFEGKRLTAYKCPGGYWTIGIGHRVFDNQLIEKLEQGFKYQITDQECTSLLNDDLDKYDRILNESKLTDHQRGALLSLIFNIGAANYKASTLRRHVLRKNFKAAANEFPKWKYSGGKVLNGLLRRRLKEREVFLTIDG